MKKPFIIIYILIIYAVVELIWWGYFVISLVPNHQPIVIGEGVLYLILFSICIYQLREALKREGKLQRQQKDFLLSVTHELKSPLAAIKLHLETMRKHDLNKDQEAIFLSKSLIDIERLNDLVENMLVAANIASKSYSYPKEEFNLSELALKTINKLQEYPSTLQTIVVNVDPEIYLNGDKFTITSVIINLIENAIKYSPPESEIRVELSQDTSHIYFRVADQGPGIKENEKSKIFDKFYRIEDESIRKAKGTGLGLFIVKEVIDSHGAYIEVKDNQPTGSIFEITF